MLPTDAPEVVTRGQVFAQRRDGDRLEAVVLPAVRLVERDLVPGLEQISYGVAYAKLAGARTTRRGGFLPARVVGRRERPVVDGESLRGRPPVNRSRVVEHRKRLLRELTKRAALQSVQPVEDALKGGVRLLDLVTPSHDDVLDVAVV